MYAVSELTIGFIISLARSTHITNLEMRKGNWKRSFGKRHKNLDIGIIGLGRIGRLVLKHLTVLELGGFM